MTDRTQKNRKGHAYIVVSTNVQMREKAAYELACSFVCEQGDEFPCLECRSCREVFLGIHPDVAEITRKTDDKGKIKKEILVEQIRQMAADAYVRPQQAERKVYIIKEADLMNIQAQNAALKIFEEPPSYAVFILCSDSEESLLPTVRSRCAVIRVKGEKETEVSSLAEEYITLAAKKNQAELSAFFGKNESIDAERMGAFIESVRICLYNAATGKKNYSGFSKNDAFRLLSLCDRAEEYLRLNVGVKHIVGLFCVLTI